MKSKLTVMSIISFTLATIYIFENLFYTFSLLVIGFVFMWGLFENKNIWYHSSAHLIVGSILAMVLASYELIYFLSNLLSIAIEDGEIHIFEYLIVIYGIISYFIFKNELKKLKNKKNQIN
jgi:fumarate reductase subunit D